MFNLADKYSEFVADPAQLAGAAAIDVAGLVATLTGDPEMVLDDDTWQAAVDLHAEEADSEALVEMVAAGLHYAGRSAAEALAELDTARFAQIREIMEKYAFLAHWQLTAAERVLARVGGGSRPGTANQDGAGAAEEATYRRRRQVAQSPAAAHVVQLLDAFYALVRIGLDALLPTRAERDVFATLFVRPSFKLLELELVARDSTLCKHILRALAIAVKRLGQVPQVQSQAVQLLIYYEHASDPLAELLRVLREQFDHPALGDAVLRELAGRQWSPSDKRGPKHVAALLERLGADAPLIALLQLPVIAPLVDANVPALRSAVVGVLANMAIFVLKEGLPEQLAQQLAERSSGDGDDDDEASEERTAAAQVRELVDLIAQRAYDIAHFVRSRAVQSLTAIVLSGARVTALRPKLADCACAKLKDRSQLVRDKAFKLMTALIETHPFRSANGRLARSAWEQDLAAAESELEEYLRGVDGALREAASQQRLGPVEEADEADEAEEADEADEADGAAGSLVGGNPPHPPGPPSAEGSSGDGAGDLEVAGTDVQAVATRDGADAEGDDAEGDGNSAVGLQLRIKYCRDALAFIAQIDAAVDTAIALLGSMARGDLVNAMDLFLVCHLFGVEKAREGIRRMVHLVWIKATNDEKESVQKKLVDCYTQLFLTAPDSASERDAALYIAGNLIELALDARGDEIKSLERVFVQMAASNELLLGGVVRMLWQIYGSEQPSVADSSRRGAAMVLGMFAGQDANIAKAGLEQVLQIGLGARGLADVELACSSCVILHRLMDPAEWQGSVPPSRLPYDHDIFVKLGTLMLQPSTDLRWLQLAKLALQVIGDLCEDPDNLYTELLKAFHERAREEENAEVQQALIAQELFVAGEAALNIAVGLDRSELLFKRRFREQAEGRLAAVASAATAAATATAAGSGTGAGAGGAATSDGAEDDLEMMGATTEDDFAEAVREIREHELLYSDTAMLAPYARLIAELAAAELKHPHWPFLGLCVTLSFSKLMLISSQYAETNLPVLLKLAEQSPRPEIRANLVVALGDLALCFNPLVDQHTAFLYGRMADPDAAVQRTAMVTLTGLILRGQIKVKGKISEMAKALESPDLAISSLAHTFFAEYATKDNAIYNSAIDILSGLVADDTLDEPKIQAILKYVMPFVDKERQIKLLAERLLARLGRSATRRQWDCTAYALKVLPGERIEACAAVLERGFSEVRGVDDPAEPDVAEAAAESATPLAEAAQDPPDIPDTDA